MPVPQRRREGSCKASGRHACVTALERPAERKRIATRDDSSDIALRVLRERGASSEAGLTRAGSSMAADRTLVFDAVRGEWASA
jgi:hypothetical protein